MADVGLLLLFYVLLLFVFLIPPRVSRRTHMLLTQIQLSLDNLFLLHYHPLPPRESFSANLSIDSWNNPVLHNTLVLIPILAILSRTLGLISSLPVDQQHREVRDV